MKRLRIVFISYWGINDGLTLATVMPWLGVMQAAYYVEKVILCTIERNQAEPAASTALSSASKITHVPLYSTERKYGTLTKVSDFVQLPREITALAKQENATMLFAHGAPAGALAYKVWKSIKLPFYVSSFEPHADYMAESGVWNRRGLKYIFQKYWERQQMKLAAGLLPVSENYRHELLRRGVAASKVITVPSLAFLDAFKFDTGKRSGLRAEQEWQDSIIGIYVGKYGGLYYQEEAFKIYKECFLAIPSFKLIILTPQPEEEIHAMLGVESIDKNDVLVRNAPYEKVPLYLSAADFAFATYKSGTAKKFLSPVKVGEYWANGLPVLLTEGVGDDSDIIKNEGGGALFNLEQEGSIERAIHQILSIIKNPQHRQEIPKLARKYRSPDRLREAFDYFFGKYEQEADV